MLIPITETDGRETWVNPLHVRAVRSARGVMGGKKSGSQLIIGGVHTDTLSVREDPPIVAARLNASLALLLNAANITAISGSLSDSSHKSSGSSTHS